MAKNCNCTPEIPEFEAPDTKESQTEAFDNARLAAEMAIESMLAIAKQCPDIFKNKKYHRIVSCEITTAWNLIHKQ